MYAPKLLVSNLRDGISYDGQKILQDPVMRSGELPRYSTTIRSRKRRSSRSGLGLRVGGTVTLAYPERFEGLANSQNGFHGCSVGRVNNC